ncbi:MAG: penicillin acylase family protein [Deltaproteobacteria bacterium]|nr:penicillin acylase family protein [Deltaproteobacteria bacterium]
MKWLKKIIGGLFILILAVLFLVLIIINPFGPSPLNKYQTDGQLILSGLKEPVKVLRDENGMAYIYAKNMDDLLMAQGFIAATDRLFQMELTKLFASGRIGELAGVSAKPIDVTMRTLGFRRQAQTHVKLLNAEAKQFVNRYIEGVNAFIRGRPKEIPLEFKLAGIKPGLWTPEDVLAIVYYMGWNSAANLPHEIVAQMLVEKLGYAKAAEIFPLNINPEEPAASETRLRTDGYSIVRLGLPAMKLLLSSLSSGRLHIGSNNWVVAPGRSQSRKPILANDPHLDSRMLPGPWYPCALILPDNRAVGVTIPGTPGVTIGRTSHVAFGVTNAYGDMQDLFIETVDPEKADHYLEGDRSFAFETIEETLKFKDKNAPDGYTTETLRIRKTHRGPVVSDVLPPLKTNTVLTFRWSAFENMEPSLGFERFFACRNAEEFREALRYVNQISLNYVFADMNGHIGWHVTGRLPIRSKGGGELPYPVKGSKDHWQGWVPFEEMPHAMNPSKGWIGTTNHMTTGQICPYYYSNCFASTYRQQRLMAIMDEANSTSAQDHWQYQRDIVNMKAKRLAPIMARILLKYDDTKTLGEILNTWDMKDDADQPAPTVFHALYSELAQLTYKDELGTDLTHAMLKDLYFWDQRLAQMIESGKSPWFDNVQTPDAVESLEDILHQAASDVMVRMKKSAGDDPQKWLWGNQHQYDFFSPIARKGAAKKWLGGGTHPADGSGDTLNRAKYDHHNLSEIQFMASLRMVADLGDADKILAVLPGGVTARQFHPHTTDQIEPFLNGKEVYWWFSDKQIQSHAKHSLLLQPPME